MLMKRWVSLTAVMAKWKPITGVVWGTGRNVSMRLTEEAMCRNKMTGGWPDPTHGCQNTFVFGVPQKHDSPDKKNGRVSMYVMLLNIISPWSGYSKPGQGQNLFDSFCRLKKKNLLQNDLFPNETVTAAGISSGVLTFLPVNVFGSRRTLPEIPLGFQEHWACCLTEHHSSHLQANSSSSPVCL